jgi:hypothetical protein
MATLRFSVSMPSGEGGGWGGGWKPMTRSLYAYLLPNCMVEFAWVGYRLSVQTKWLGGKTHPLCWVACLGCLHPVRRLAKLGRCSGGRIAFRFRLDLTICPFLEALVSGNLGF